MKDYSELVNQEKDKFLTVLNSISQLLMNAGYKGQAGVIFKLVNLIYENNLNQFRKLLNGVDMWGGAGAVWEVYIDNESEAMMFKKEMFRLIQLMEKVDTVADHVTSLKAFFENNYN